LHLFPSTYSSRKTLATLDQTTRPISGSQATAVPVVIYRDRVKLPLYTWSWKWFL